MQSNTATGAEGEKLAQAFLQSIGYTILERNWRHRKYEIDLIAMDGEVIVFVEVKSRASADFGEPEMSVTPRKQGFLVAAAHYYLEDRVVEAEARFDIVSVLFGNGEAEIKHLPAAFTPLAK